MKEEEFNKLTELLKPGEFCEKFNLTRAKYELIKNCPHLGVKFVTMGGPRSRMIIKESLREMFVEKLKK